MDKTLKNILAILALPFTWGFSKAFYSQLMSISYMGSKMHFFLWGIVIYMLIHILFFKPIYIYTLGHEAIHVVATWLCGGHVTHFNISPSGGNVTTSKTNFFIELSPYFVPIYTLMLILLIPVIRYWLTGTRFFSYYLLLLGFSVGMHLIMTAGVIKMKQPDIASSGYIFSLGLIYIVNLLIIFLVFAVLVKDLSFKTYIIKSIQTTEKIYLAIWRKIF